MLVLSRKKDETICIGDSIELTVVDIRGDKVRLGIEAPKTVIVDREEIRQRKLSEKSRDIGGASAEPMRGTGQRRPNGESSSVPAPVAGD